MQRLLLLLLLGYTSAEYTTSSTTYSCHGNSGDNFLSPILDLDMCQEAALNMGLSYTYTDHVSTSQQTGGCFLDSDVLVFNEVPSSYKSCTNGADYCLCRSLPICFYRDATSIDNTDSCLCDPHSKYDTDSSVDLDSSNVDLICTPDTGLYCFSLSSGQEGCHPGDDCLEQDGSTANSVDCACGTTPSNSQHGRFCYSTANKVSSDPINVCINRDGSVINNNACECGISTCGENEYCTESHSICTTTVVPSFCQIGGDGDGVKNCATGVTVALDAAVTAAEVAQAALQAAQDDAATAAADALQAAATAADALQVAQDDAATAALAATNAAADLAAIETSLDEKQSELDAAQAAAATAQSNAEADALQAAATAAAALQAAQDDAATAAATAAATCSAAQDDAATAAATAAAALQAAQAEADDAALQAQSNAEAAALQAQDELDAADALLAKAAEVCPEVQSAGGVYSVGPLDCDRIHSVYQNNQCCGTC